MKILTLDLLAYGHFTDHTLDFSRGQEGLHLVHGPNEAGKSTTLRALMAWLFGIPGRTDDNFVHDYGQLRLGGVIERRDGEQLAFVRRKGNKDTMLHPSTGEPLDEALLQPFLPGLDEELFARLHAIDHDRLVEGGRAILTEGGDVGATLFGAALGTAGLRDLLGELEGEADELFKPRASKPVVNRAVGEYKEAHATMRKASLKVSEWRDLKRNLAAVEDELQRVEASIGDTTAARNQLERCRRVSPYLAELRELDAALGDLGPVPTYPDDLAIKRDALVAAREEAERSLRHATRRKEALAAETREIRVSAPLMEARQTIERLYRQVDGVERDMETLPREQSRWEHLRADARGELRALRPDLTLEVVEGLRGLKNRTRAIDALADDRTKLVEAEDQQRRRLRELEDRSRELTEALAAIPTSEADLTSLTLAVDVARREGDLADRLARAAERVAKEALRCDEELARLGRFSGSLDDLARCAVPVRATIDEMGSRFDTLAGRAKERDRLDEVDADERRQLNTERRHLEATGEIPTRAELEAARGARDEQWRQIRRWYVAPDEPTASPPEGAEPGHLADTFEHAVDRADDVADRLMTDAERVQRLVQLEERQRQVDERIQQRRHRSIEDQGAREELVIEWQGLWEPLGIAAGTPDEMQLWLVRVATLLQRRETKLALDDEVAALGAKLEEVTGGLLTALEASGTPTDRDRPLAELLATAEGLIGARRAHQEEQRTLTRALAEVERDTARARDMLADAAARLERWQDEWRHAIDGLGLGTDASPAMAKAALDSLERVFRAVDEAESLSRTIAGLRLRIGTFDGEIASLAESLSWPVEGKASPLVVMELHDALTEAREDAARRDELVEQQRALDEAAAKAADTFEEATRSIESLYTRVGVESLEAFDVELTRAAKHTALQTRRAQLEAELLRHGDGLTPDELAEEARGIEVDRIDALVEAHVHTLAALATTRDELRDERRTIEADLDSKDGESSAARAAEEASEALATIVEGTETYLTVKLAALLLERRIEAFRQNHQTPLLTRAAELFRVLTLESFVGLRDELDPRGTPVLLGLRDDNREVPVEGMSDGTRDQLFLALRLATLEQHLSQGEPMPFVVDDILVGFDDERTAACLGVLRDLSRRTQVLLFTHHHRVVELARALDAPEDVFVHDLESSR